MRPWQSLSVIVQTTSMRYKPIMQYGLSRGKLERTAVIPEDDLPELVRRVTALSLLLHSLLFGIIYFRDTMDFEDALTRTEDGVIVNVEVSPGSKKMRIPAGYDLWRKRIEVKISEQAQKGKANKQIIESFSVLFSLKTSDVSIISGQKSSKKSIFLHGADYSMVVSVLHAKLDAV